MGWRRSLQQFVVISLRFCLHTCALKSRNERWLEGFSVLSQSILEAVCLLVDRDKTIKLCLFGLRAIALLLIHYVLLQIWGCDLSQLSGSAAVLRLFIPY